MKYVTLNSEAFLDEEGDPSMEFLSQYCQLPTTKKFIYDGGIDGTYYDMLSFPNIVKGYAIDSKEIAKQFPDLEKVYIIYYTVHGTPDIGNLKSAGIFHMYFFNNTSMTMQFIKKYVEIINENTLIINGKELNVKYGWRIGSVESYNYKEFGL